MKKTISAALPLSVAIAAVFASGVQAKTVYKDDSMYLNLTGEVAFEFVRDVNEDDKVESKTDDLDLEVTVGYKLDNGVEVGGFYELEFNSMTGNGTDTDFVTDAYLFAKKDAWTVQYGDQDYAVDDFGIRKNLDAKTATEFVLNPDDSENTPSQEVLLVKYKGDGVYVSVSHDLNLDTGSDSDDETGYDIFAEFDLTDDVAVGATYSVQDYADDGKFDSYGVQIEYSGIKDLTLGASWAYGENYNQKEWADNEATGLEFAASYKVSSKVKLAAGVGTTSPENDAYEDLTIWYVNGNYNFTKNVDAYAEIYDEDAEQQGFVVGLSVDF